MNDKTIKKNITRLWNQAYINYDDCYAHGLKSEEEKKEWQYEEHIRSRRSGNHD